MLFNLLASASASANKNNFLTWIILGVFVVLAIAFFIFSSRSNKKKQEEAKNMINAMKIGDKVKTIGGVCGYLYEINEEEGTIVLETGTNERKSYVKFDKAAIYQTAPVKGIQSAEDFADDKKSSEESK